MHYGQICCGREKHGLKLSGHNDIYMYTNWLGLKEEDILVKVLFQEPKILQKISMKKCLDKIMKIYVWTQTKALWTDKLCTCIYLIKELWMKDVFPRLK